ncbi:MAG TPA: aspartate kinase [Chitinophagaceae bacterium]|mgnify:CR=1 FL=1|nr:MAG: aspartate kinase [Bacteroidetes bacterium OLB11]HMN32469.1 aspartate kinase [Chitinophagaceae bacterium]
MEVYKFGGASIESVERARNVADIISENTSEKKLIVISAKGKTTNHLEHLVKAYYNKETEKAKSLFEDLKKDHLLYAQELIKSTEDITPQLEEFFIEIEWILNTPPHNEFDYYYDQIVCIGELLSTYIISFYLNSIHIENTWVDIRDILKTDSNYRDANIYWKQTEECVQKQIVPLFQKKNFIITQGFIGSTNENNSVTLGREGSDYTSAILAHILNAKRVTIWKDVPSLLNGDPKIFPHTVPIKEITFYEVIEMAYYGAQVIHPKTIKPLQNKNIPLYVKCFLDKKLQGTKIFNTDKKIKYPPILVLKTNQILLQVYTKDYSFITEKNLSKIYSIFHHCKIKINLMQNAAISFVACIDTHSSHLDELLNLLEKDYTVKRNENLFLFTVRHYKQNVLREELKNRTVLLTQKTRNTIQMVVQ